MQIGIKPAVAVTVATSEPATTSQTKWSPLLTILSAAVLVLGLSADVALRFLPADWFTFRAWEAAGLYPTAEGPYTPNLVYNNTRAWGDLANLGNLPKLRQFRSETFSTDAWGYRNSGNPSNEPIHGILVGDSYSVGSGVSDQETLPGQLGKLSGLNVYNGAGRPHDWPSLHKLISRLNMRDGLVIWQESELWPIPDHVESNVESSRPGRIARLAPSIEPLYRKLQTSHLLLHNWLEYSPAEIVLSRMFRTVQNGQLLPNPRSRNVAVRSLENGQAMLFLNGSVNTYPNPHPIPTSFFAELNSLVKATGNELLVVLVPDKYTVYAPLLDAPPAVGENELYLNRLETRIHSNGVRVLNLTGILRAQAAHGIRRAEYNYWIDDTHWNAAGIRTAAEQVSNHVRQSFRLTGQSPVQAKGTVERP